MKENYLSKKPEFSTAQKMKFSIRGLFSKCDQFHRKLQTWSHLLKKFLMENFIFCTVYGQYFADLGGIYKNFYLFSKIHKIMPSLQSNSVFGPLTVHNFSTRHMLKKSHYLSALHVCWYCTLG